jgi:hypothetical protein
VHTKLDSKIARLHLGGNPWIPLVKAILKNGGVARLFQSMKEPGWEQSIEKELE